ncbi:multivesicular body subunit 12A [Denticeps clupeoides]|uniref:Multivesicular body subunit 12A n=1 Tax=Denticeps clupeoides TaxID=299321 RepID=A0AAY3ZU32_9TELE|nr:multivesicular body subunit 12A [Denticeps clupeoides]
MSSLHERGGAPSWPISAVAWTASSNTCPPGFHMISQTEDGAAASFNRGFSLKSGYFLCYTKDSLAGMVIADVQIITEKDAIPHGFCYIPEFLEQKVSKKKRLCVRIVPVDSVATAVLDIKLTGRSKMMLKHYTCIGEMHGFVIWCKKGPFSTPAPIAKPRRVSLDLRQLSLDGPGPQLPLRQSNPPAAAPRISQRRSEMKAPVESVYDASSIYGITAMDGVPFVLHPKFEDRSKGKVPTVPLNDIQIKSVQDIENEYNYAFTVEELATKRKWPTVSETSQA